jgi:hypothetical protein
MKKINKNYDELLRHPKWQKRRLKIMERDNWACSVCSEKEKALNVHHKTYGQNNKPWEYPDTNLETLCHDCHSKKHQITDVFKKMSLEEKFNVFRKAVEGIPCETKELDEFFITTHPNDPKYCFIVHVPSMLFSSFCVNVQEAYDRMKSDPELMPKIKKIIIDKLTRPDAFD